MPLLAWMCWSVALGLLAAVLGARELRSSPRGVTQLRSFVALATHEVVVAVPVTFWVLARHTDWALSYAAEGAKVPSAALLVAALTCAGLALGGFAAGAWWIRAHQPRLPNAVALGLLGIGLLGCVVLHHRVGLVGSTVQYRGGFGLSPLVGSRVLGTVAVAGLGYLVAYVHLAWTLRSRL
ncbi:MAG: hypothetical protein IPF99_06085 [Deltaproteobacteria bacterium]|nr:hypothetical protein [Deltaproteobacteria bacterium]